MWLSNFLFQNKVFTSKNQAKKECANGTIEIDGKPIYRDIKLNHENYKITLNIGTDFKINLESK